MNLTLHPIVKGILSILAVTVIGFFLLNLAFILDALFQGLIDAVVSIFYPIDYDMLFNYEAVYWYPPLKHGLFVVLIGIISWYVFRSKLGDVWKATYMVVPMATVLLTIGIFTSVLPGALWPLVSISLGTLFTLVVLYYLYRTKQPWIYYYSAMAMALTMLMVVLFGVEI